MVSIVLPSHNETNKSRILQQSVAEQQRNIVLTLNLFDTNCLLQGMVYLSKNVLQLDSDWLITKVGGGHLIGGVGGSNSNIWYCMVYNT